MLDQLMQYGILAAVLIFGLKIGLALGFSGIKKRTVGYILIGYGVGLTVLSYLAQPYTEILYNFVKEGGKCQNGRGIRFRNSRNGGQAG